MEEIKDVQFFQKLALKGMYRLSEEEAQSLADEFPVIEAQFALLEKIDTENTEPMVYPFEAPTRWMREDNADHVLTREEALSNAEKQAEGHFVLPRVVK